MADYERGYCNYCGKYRPLRYRGGYCSQQCYRESGQQEQDEADEEHRQELWYERDDLVAVAFRTVSMTIGWWIFWYAAYTKFKPLFLQKILSAIPLWVDIIILFIISIVQNIIVRNRGKTFRCLIYYGIPIIIAVILFISNR